MPFYWPSSSPPFCLLLFSFSFLSFYGLIWYCGAGVFDRTDRVFIALSQPFLIIIKIIIKIIILLLIIIHFLIIIIIRTQQIQSFPKHQHSLLEPHHPYIYIKQPWRHHTALFPSNINRKPLAHIISHPDTRTTIYMKTLHCFKQFSSNSTHS